MKKVLLIALVIGSLFSLQAQTNLTVEVESGKSEVGSYEFTLGGAGTHIDGESAVGVDLSLSTNPFKFAPNVWVGIVQGLYWEPDFAGSTDLNINYSWHLFKELYVNTGWSAGVEYTDVETESEDGTENVSFEGFFRTGPEVTFQYYVGDNAFLYSGVNYDFVSQGEDGFRYSFGIGLAF